MLPIRVHPAIADQARRDPSGLRAALAAWASGRQPPPAKPRAATGKAATPLWRCTSCGGLTMRSRVDPGACTCGGGLVPGRWRYGERQRR